MGHEPDKFQDFLAEVAIGIAMLLFIAGIMSAGWRSLRVLDDGGGHSPSAWEKGR